MRGRRAANANRRRVPASPGGRYRTFNRPRQHLELGATWPHHSRAVAETNSNYANVLTLYDRMLGTYTPSERAASVVYGLDDVDPGSVASFPALLSMPFQTSGAADVPDTKVRIEGGVGQ